MTALWTSAEADAATCGTSTQSWAAVGISIDSRTVGRDELFVALKGPHHDGHDHIAAAFDRGAAAALIHRLPQPGAEARKRVVRGKRVYGRVDLGGHDIN